MTKSLKILIGITFLPFFTNAEEWNDEEMWEDGEFWGGDGIWEYEEIKDEWTPTGEYADRGKEFSSRGLLQEQECPCTCHNDGGQTGCEKCSIIHSKPEGESGKRSAQWLTMTIPTLSGAQRQLISPQPSRTISRTHLKKESSVRP